MSAVSTSNNSRTVLSPSSWAASLLSLAMSASSGVSSVLADSPVLAATLTASTAGLVAVAVLARYSPPPASGRHSVHKHSHTSSATVASDLKKGNDSSMRRSLSRQQQVGLGTTVDVVQESPSFSCVGRRRSSELFGSAGCSACETRTSSATGVDGHQNRSRENGEGEKRPMSTVDAGTATTSSLRLGDASVSKKHEESRESTGVANGRELAALCQLKQRNALLEAEVATLTKQVRQMQDDYQAEKQQSDTLMVEAGEQLRGALASEAKLEAQLTSALEDNQQLRHKEMQTAHQLRKLAHVLDNPSKRGDGFQQPPQVGNGHSGAHLPSSLSQPTLVYSAAASAKTSPDPLYPFD